MHGNRVAEIHEPRFRIEKAHQVRAPGVAPGDGLAGKDAADGAHVVAQIGEPHRPVADTLSARCRQGRSDEDVRA